MSSGPAGHPPRRLILGYGNPLRGDDAAGPLLAGRLAALALPGVSILTVHQLTPELAARLAECDTVVFVDAALQGVVGVQRVFPEPASPGLGHVSRPAQLLALAEDLYGARPAAWLVTVPAVQMEFGAGLSPQARAGLEAALTEVRQVLGPSTIAGL